MSDITEYYPHLSSTGKRYRIIINDDDGQEYYEYESGVIRDPRKGVLVKPFFKALKEQDKTHEIVEHAHHGNEVKKDLAVERARAGLIRGVGAREIVDDWGIAWEFVVAAQAELAMSPEMGNASTRAAEFIARMADLDPKNNRQSMTITDGQNTLSLGDLPPEKLNYILSRLTGGD